MKRKTVRLRIVRALLLMVPVSVSSCEISVSSPNGNSGNTQINSRSSQTNTPSVTDAAASPSAASPCHPPSLDANRKIILTSPCDGGTVPPRTFVEGIVSNSSAKVWVIVHPMETTDYWVQPSVTRREGGQWKVLCYFGETGPARSGKHYEVLAIVSPKKKLTEDQLLAEWPEAQSKSQVVEVVRE